MKAADFSVGLAYSVKKRQGVIPTLGSSTEHGVHQPPHVCEHKAVSQHSGTLNRGEARGF